MAKRKKASRRQQQVYLNVRLQFGEVDKALAEYVKQEASRNRRLPREQIMFMLQFAAAQANVPRRPPSSNDDDNGVMVNA